jgi:predicted nucleic acid-binding Zn ribbon protein
MISATCCLCQTHFDQLPDNIHNALSGYPYFLCGSCDELACRTLSGVGFVFKRDPQGLFVSDSSAIGRWIKTRPCLQCGEVHS